MSSFGCTRHAADFHSNISGPICLALRVEREESSVVHGETRLGCALASARHRLFESVHENDQKEYRMCALQAGSMASRTGTRYGERPSLVHAPLRLPSFSASSRPSAKTGRHLPDLYRFQHMQQPSMASFRMDLHPGSALDITAGHPAYLRRHGPRTYGASRGSVESWSGFTSRSSATTNGKPSWTGGDLPSNARP